MSIKNWPALERPREKLLSSGAKHLSDAELLAIFLRTGIKGKTAVDLARDLLQQFGNLRQLLTATEEQFCSAPGLGQAKYALLQATLEIAKRHQWQKLNRDIPLSSPQSTKNFLKSQLRDYSYEVFACLFLDSQHRVICFEEIFRGTIDAANVYPREIVQQALLHKSAAVILSHNHPSGRAQSSSADRQITHKLIDALQLVDIRVLDHIIVGDQNCYSFAENGLI